VIALTRDLLEPVADLARLYAYRYLRMTRWLDEDGAVGTREPTRSDEPRFAHLGGSPHQGAVNCRLTIPVEPF
jgi:hypothetical protein